MHAIVAFALMAFIVPFTADAAGFDRSAVKKPVRGRYERHSRQPAVRPVPRQASESIAMRSYINETLGISLNHPSTWAVKESKNSFWLEPISTEEALTMQRDSAILVTVYDIPYKRDYSLKEINKRYKSNVSLNATGLSWSWYMKSYRLLDSGDATLFGKPGRYFDSTGDVGGDKYRVLHTAASFDKKLFEVRYRSHPDTFEKDLPAFQEMLATLSLGTPESIPSSARDRRRERAARRAGQ